MTEHTRGDASMRTPRFPDPLGHTVRSGHLSKTRSRRRGLRLGAVALAATAFVAACGSSGSAGGGSAPASASAGSGTTYKIGVITDLTGALASVNKNVPQAIKAGTLTAADEGYTIKYVVVDGQSTPAGELSAAQRLVTQEHVLAVIPISDLAFAAAPYLTAHNIPVLGGAVDGPEWNTSKNMFSTFGFPDYAKVETTQGQFYKKVGATNVGAIGYGNVPSSAEAAKAASVSAQTAGLKTGYLNAQFPIGSTDVGPAVLQMKNAGIDGIEVALQRNTGFAIIKALRQQGVALKAPVLADGYGQDLLSAGPADIQNAQDVYFTVGWEPVEMHTPATEKFEAALKKAGYDGEPGLGEYLAYTAVDAFVAGLKAAGANVTQASLISALLTLRSYNPAGLYGDHTIGFAMDQRGLGGAGNNCLYYTQFKGKTFSLVPGADPVCGTVIPGKKVG
jgi:branched-chain amino acid transport system substrate-binding protein